jgi:hypothetical protein
VPVSRYLYCLDEGFAGDCFFLLEMGVVYLLLSLLPFSNLCLLVAETLFLGEDG